jgi:hypothetical protein
MAFEPRISIITLGVADMARSIRFYRDGLGWPTDARDDAGWAIFRTAGTRFALFPRHLLAEDANLPAEGEAPQGTFNGVTLAHNARTKDQVDEILAMAERAEGRILKPAAKGKYIAWGGYFADPDGHAWEVAWDPIWQFTSAGEIYGGPLVPLPDASPSVVGILRRQFQSSQTMLANVIRTCPDSAWSAGTPGIWQHAYHVLLGNAIWLRWPEPSISFPSFHHEGAGELVHGETPVFSRSLVEEYQRQVQADVAAYFERLTEASLREELTLRGTTFTRADLIVGQMRHIQHHVGCMHTQLRQRTGTAPPWVGFGE